MTTPAAPPGAVNDADLRYLRGTLSALGDAHLACDVAAAQASDPRVRALARQAGATQADEIREITSMLLGCDRPEGSPDQPPAAARVRTPATGTDEARSPDRHQVDRRFIEVLTAHAETSLARARMELVEGFGGAIRRLAEDTSRASWRELAALSLLVPAPDHERGDAT